MNIDANSTPEEVKAYNIDQIMRAYSAEMQRIHDDALQRLTDAINQTDKAARKNLTMAGASDEEISEMLGDEE